MNKELFLIFQFSLFVGLTNIHSQADYFKNYQYNISHGLASQTIYNALEDREGFLWICTDAGVGRFDGIHFVNYTTDDGLGENEILEMYEDSRGRIWFSPFYGPISFWYKNKFHSYQNDTLLQKINTHSGIRHILEDYNKNIIIKYDSPKQQLTRIDSNDQVSTLYLSPYLDKLDITNHFFLNEKKEITLVTKNKIWLTIKDSTICIINSTASDLKNYKVITSSDCKTAFILDAEGIKIFKKGKLQILLEIEYIPSPELISCLNIDANGNLWMTHSKLNNLVYLKSGDKFTKPISILKNLQSNVCFDHSSNAWLCSSTGGLAKIPLDGLTTKNILFNSNLMHENITSSYCQKDGSIWIGYPNGYVTLFSKNKIEHINLNKGTRYYNRVLDIGEDPNGRMYFCLDEGGCRLKKQKNSSYNIDYFNDKAKRNHPGKGLFYTRDKKVLFSYSHQFDGFPDQIGNYQAQYFHRFKERRFSHFINDEGNILLSAIDGLIKITKDSMKNLSKEQIELKCRVNKFYQLKNGHIILATHGEGIFILDNNRIIAHIKEKDGLAGNICRHIITNKDTIWAGTNGGISGITLNSASYNVFKNINTSDGLISNDINSLFFRDHLLYAATSKGLAVIDYINGDKKHMDEPIVIIQSFMINGIEHSSDETFELKNGDYHFKINFITPNLSQDKLLSYRYKVEPQDSNWIYTKSTSLEFAHLNYGNYKIQIQSKFKNSEWSKSAIIEWSIIPPFYTLWWFLLLSFTFFAGIAVFISRFFIKKKYSKALNAVMLQAAVENERNRISTDIHDDIGSDLTNMVILSRIIKNNSNNNILSIANKLESTANELINKMGEVIWALNPANDSLEDLISYIHYYIKSFIEHNNLVGEFKFEGISTHKIPLSAQQRRNTFLVIKEFLHNTLKHAAADKIGIYVHVSNNFLQIEIYDNGIGLNYEEQHSSGNGLLNIKKRITQSGGTYRFSKNQPTGFKLNFRLPLTIYYENK